MWPVERNNPTSHVWYANRQRRSGSRTPRLCPSCPADVPVRLDLAPPNGHHDKSQMDWWLDLPMVDDNPRVARAASHRPRILWSPIGQASARRGPPGSFRAGELSRALDNSRPGRRLSAGPSRGQRRTIRPQVFLLHQLVHRPASVTPPLVLPRLVVARTGFRRLA